MLYEVITINFNVSYSETLDYLFTRLPMFQRSGPAAYKNSLDNTLRLDEIYGHPHRKFKTIHVAGTNGKGSVSHMLAAILQSAGYKTGLYTSPHLKDVITSYSIHYTKLYEAASAFSNHIYNRAGPLADHQQKGG